MGPNYCEHKTKSFSQAKENIFDGLNQCISYPCKKRDNREESFSFQLKIECKKNVNSKINNNSSDKYSLEVQSYPN